MQQKLFFIVKKILTTQYGSKIPAEFVFLLTQRLTQYYFSGIPIQRPPYFQDEISKPILTTFLPIKQVLDLPENLWLDQLSKEIKNISFEKLLILAGQRFTSASLKSLAALPPEKKHLIQTFDEPFNSELSVGTRALTKHINRTANSFWGELKGNNSFKNQQARSILFHLIKHQTWWNTFEHYQLDTVYEIRIASGFGMRWQVKPKLKFIGFLEPFLND